ncbi:MAG TPA: response regulator [Gemmataceae bacterium]|nr:response regulator [Gemmataceae bacterium]
MRIQSVPSEAVDILIIEDDDLTREAFRRLLVRRGYRCTEASDGRQALTMARDQPPTHVLLDLVLPDLDGFSVARRLRADLRTFAAHIYCLTGLRDSLIREQALRAGCEELLTKPVDEASLLKLVGPPQKEKQPRSVVVSGLTKAQAEDLLDWMENHACTGLAVRTEEAGFAVRCICPSGFDLVLDRHDSLRLASLEP